MARHRFVIDQKRLLYPALAVVMDLARENGDFRAFDFGPFDDRELRETQTIEVVGSDGVAELVANRLLDQDIGFEVGESDGSVSLADSHATGGISLAQKQAWMQSHGKPKSWAYFATSGKLGSGWDWNTAIGGGYTDAQVQQFLGQTGTAYEAHKAAQAAKKTPVPDVDVPIGPGAACATTAGKAIISVVGKINVHLDQVLPWFVLKDLSGLGEETIDFVKTYRKAATDTLKEVIEQTGQHSIETKALRGMIEFMDAMDATAKANLSAYKIGMAPLSAMDDFKNAWWKAVANDDRLEAIVALDDGIHSLSLEQLRSQVSLGRAQIEDLWKQGFEWWLDVPYMEVIWQSYPTPATAIYPSAFSELVDEFVGAAINPDLPPLSVPEIIEFFKSVEATDEVLWAAFAKAKELGLVDEGLEFVAFLERLGPNYRVQLMSAHEQMFTKLPAMLGKYDEAYFTSDSFAVMSQLAEAGEDFKTQLDELVTTLQHMESSALVDNLYVGSGYTETTIGHHIDDIIPVINDAENAFDAASLVVAEQLPGPATTLVDEGYKAQVMAAGTDELNAAVKAKMAEVAPDETPSLAHFMTKEQKQDFLILPYDEFAEKSYAVKFKGATLEGTGFGTASQKYAIKKGAPPKVATTSATGTSKVTGQPTPISTAVDMGEPVPMSMLEDLSQKLNDLDFDWTTPMAGEQTFAHKFGATMTSAPDGFTKDQVSSMLQALDLPHVTTENVDTIMYGASLGKPSLGSTAAHVTAGQLDDLVFVKVEAYGGGAGDDFAQWLAGEKFDELGYKTITQAAVDGDLSVAQLHAVSETIDQLASDGAFATFDGEHALTVKIHIQGALKAIDDVAGPGAGYTLATSSDMGSMLFFAEQQNTLVWLKNAQWNIFGDETLEMAVAHNKVTVAQIEAAHEAMAQAIAAGQSNVGIKLKMLDAMIQAAPPGGVAQAIDAVDIAASLVDIPPGGPAWWAKSITMKQVQYLETADYALLPKLEGWTPGSLPLDDLKGYHASQLIDGIKSGTIKTLDDAKAVLTGKPVAEAHDWIALSQTTLVPGDAKVAFGKPVIANLGASDTIKLYTTEIPGVGKTWEQLGSAKQLTHAHAQALADLAAQKTTVHSKVTVAHLADIIAEPKYGKVATTSTPITGTGTLTGAAEAPLSVAQQNQVTHAIVQSVTGEDGLSVANYAYTEHQYELLGGKTLQAAVEDGTFTQKHLEALQNYLIGKAHSVEGQGRLVYHIEVAIKKAEGPSQVQVIQFTNTWKAQTPNAATIASETIANLGHKSLNQVYMDGDLTQELLDFLEVKAAAGELSDAGKLNVVIGQFKSKQVGVSSTQAAVVEEVVEFIPEETVTFGSAVSQQAQHEITSAGPVGSWNDQHSWTYVGDGSKWGGAHRKWEFVDENGEIWMLKNGDLFRAEGESAAHRIAHMAGFDIAEGHATTQVVGGRRTHGFIQRMFPEVDGEFADIGLVRAADLAGADEATLRAIQEQQVLDWLLGNHDGHAGNFMRLRDGRVVGIDKGQAFKWLGKDRLDPDWIPTGNVKHGAWTYQELWKGYRSGKIDLDLDAIGDVLRRIEAMSDAELRAVLRPYAEGRFAAAGSKAFLQGTTAKNADELVELVVARKHAIRDDFTTLYQRMATERGVEWTPKWAEPVAPKVKQAAPKVVNAGDILTPIDDEFAAVVREVGSSGRTVYVAGTEVERGQIMFDVVKDADGRHILRVNAHLRPEGDARVMKIITDEGGASIATQGAQVATGPQLPPRLAVFREWNQKVVSGAKTVNYHIKSADFTFNQGTLDALDGVRQQVETRMLALRTKYGLSESDDLVQAVESRWIRTIQDQVDDGLRGEELAKLIDEASEEIAETKGLVHVHPHTEDIAQQAAKGEAAEKVQMFAEYDPQAAWLGEKDVLEHRFVDALDDEALVLKAKEPEKVFDSIERRSCVTSQVDLGTEGPIATYTGIGSTNGEMTYHGSTRIGGQRADVLYRDHAQQGHAHKGWLEMIIPTESGEVTTADIQRAFDFITDRLGVQTRLATAEEMELTYWRVVKGAYQFSSEGTSTTAKIGKAIAEADRRLAALGPSPTVVDEIDAIRGSFREVFGPIIDDVDVLPIHSRKLAEGAPEYGWGFWERPELTDSELREAWGDVVLQHRSRYGDGPITGDHFRDVAGHGGMSQQARQEMGWHGAASGQVGSDVRTGGSGSFYLSPTSVSGLSDDSFIVNPVRRSRRLLDYNARSDTFGRLSERGGSRLSPKASAATNRFEWMARDQASYWDDVEITFFSSDSARNDALRRVQDRLGPGGLWRGVDPAERLVGPSQLSGTTRTAYVRDFFRRNVDLGERLRRGTEQFIQVSKTAHKKVIQLGSRLRVKGGRLAKKLSSGRTETYRIALQGTYNRSNVPIRYHAVENALSISTDAIAQFPGGWPGLQQVKIAIDGGEQAFKIGHYTVNSESVVIDLAEFGIDIKVMGKYERLDFTRELLEALRDGTIDDFIRKWNPSAALAAA